METISVTLNSEDIQKIVRGAIEPGSVLLPPSAVGNLMEHMSLTASVDDVYMLLAQCGGLLASEAE